MINIYHINSIVVRIELYLIDLEQRFSWHNVRAPPYYFLVSWSCVERRNILHICFSPLLTKKENEIWINVRSSSLLPIIWTLTTPSYRSNKTIQIIPSSSIKYSFWIFRLLVNYSFVHSSFSHYSVFKIKSYILHRLTFGILGTNEKKLDDLVSHHGVTTRKHPIWFEPVSLLVFLVDTYSIYSVFLEVNWIDSLFGSRIRVYKFKSTNHWA